MASPDLTIKGTREAIVLALMSGKPDQAMAQGSIKIEGRAAALTELFNLTTPPASATTDRPISELPGLRMIVFTPST